MTEWIELGILHLILGMTIVFLFSIILGLIVQIVEPSIKVARKINSVRKAHKMYKTYRNEILAGIISSIAYHHRLFQERKAIHPKLTSVKGRFHDYWSLAGRFECTGSINGVHKWLSGLGWVSLSKVKFHVGDNRECI
ncbi:hypothetical protein CW703_04410 [Candidatus Bathyarchaeota archaeon]|nr:MAG: hypothetical protein CW703_04410 [Candidatus Bathyarchaeota archaeon]